MRTMIQAVCQQKAGSLRTNASHIPFSHPLSPPLSYKYPPIERRVP